MIEDGLDEIIESLQATNSTKLLPKPKTCTATAPDEPYDASIEAIVDKLRLLLVNLADSEYCDHVNKYLSKISFAKFTSYYITNTSLGKYSMNAELQRLHVELQYPSSSGTIVTTDKMQILSFYESCQLHDIWRFCNQSIFAEIYSYISSTYLPSHLVPYISIVATAASIRIDFATKVVATCCLEYYINTTTETTSATTTAADKKSTSTNKLSLAKIHVEVVVDLALKKVQQCIVPPDVNMIFDHDLRCAARAMQTDAAIPTIVEDIQPTVSIADIAEKSRFATNRLLEGAVASLGKLLGADSNHADTLYQRPAANATSTTVDNTAKQKEEEWDDW